MTPKAKYFTFIFRFFKLLSFLFDIICSVEVMGMCDVVIIGGGASGIVSAIYSKTKEQI